MPTEAHVIIKFLNSKTKEEMEALQIEDMTKTILEVKRVLTKKGLMPQLEERVQEMDVVVQTFFIKLNLCRRKVSQAFL
jgi:hypothetical protein